MTKPHILLDPNENKLEFHSTDINLLIEANIKLLPLLVKEKVTEKKQPEDKSPKVTEEPKESVTSSDTKEKPKFFDEDGEIIPKFERDVINLKGKILRAIARNDYRWTPGTLANFVNYRARDEEFKEAVKELLNEGKIDETKSVTGYTNYIKKTKEKPKVVSTSVEENILTELDKGSALGLGTIAQRLGMHHRELVLTKAISKLIEDSKIESFLQNGVKRYKIMQSKPKIPKDAIEEMKELYNLLDLNIMYSLEEIKAKGREIGLDYEESHKLFSFMKDNHLFEIHQPSLGATKFTYARLTDEEAKDIFDNLYK